MGWLYYGRVPGDIRAEIARICESATTEPRMRAIAIARVGTTWYAALEARYATPEAARACSYTRAFPPTDDGRYVFGAVFLTQIGGDGWGYKDLDETMGPVASEAPAAILDRLTPTTAPHALDWRQRCRSGCARTPDELWLGDTHED